MKKPLIAEMISVGTELLLGEIIDTNAAFLGERLRDLGIFVYRRQTLGDNLERLVAAVKEALGRSDLLILCGGLGPTDDDLTREAIAAAVNEEPYIDDALLKDLEAKFAARKRPMPEGNKSRPGWSKAPVHWPTRLVQLQAGMLTRAVKSLWRCRARRMSLRACGASRSKNCCRLRAGCSTTALCIRSELANQILQKESRSLHVLILPESALMLETAVLMCASPLLARVQIRPWLWPGLLFVK